MIVSTFPEKRLRKGESIFAEFHLSKFGTERAMTYNELVEKMSKIGVFKLFDSIKKDP